ncbi:MAG: hypothetical protein VYE22_28450 [Myxococcota bacterium]|nr:hypothetical protein [Myxococcota bacterium]
MTDPGRTDIALAQLGDDQEFDKYELRRELRSRIGTAALLAARSDEELVILSREHFETDVPAGSEAFAEAVLERLETNMVDPPPMPRSRQFVRRVLGFKTRPQEKRAELLADALSDLEKVEELIDFYEALPAVAAWLRGEGVRSHEARMRVDFYLRCTKERASIARYVTGRTGAGEALSIDDEALRRSDDDDVVRRAFASLVSIFAEEPPYRWRLPRAAAYFDFRKINRWRHRLRPLPIKRGRELGELYETGDTEGFYRELEKDRPPEELFDGIDRASRQIPRLGQRQPTFTELRALWAAQHWQGAYALALPQIEGLFAEMGQLAAPARKKPRQALPDKVRFIREYAEVHEQNLDYFEYLLPIERNRFSHSGRIEDPELRWKEVLHDLAYVSELYTEISTPVVEVARLLIERSEQRELRTWARVFELVEVIEAADQFEEIREPLESFLNHHLPDDGTKRKVAAELGELLKDASTKTLEMLTAAVQERLGVEMDLRLKKKTREMVERAIEIVDILDELDALNSGPLVPSQLRQVMRGISTHGKLPQDAMDVVEAAVGAEETWMANLDSLIELAVRQP